MFASVAAVAVEPKRFDWVKSVRAHAVWIVAMFAVLASITSITNGFALDDVHIIFENDRIHSLSNIPHLFVETYWPPIEGASLYRPLTMVLFTIEWVIGRGSPMPFHVVNIALYAIACAAFYRLLTVAVNRDAAIVAAVLFAVHPVHSEAVANTVGQAELLVAIFMFLGVTRYIEARRRGPFRASDFAIVLGSFIAGLLSKEHALVMPGLLAAAEVLIDNRDQRFGDSAKRTWMLFGSMVVAAVAFMLVRTAVVGAFRAGGSNEILAGQPFSARFYTMLNVMMDWVRLFVWPAQLSADYSFPRTRLSTGPELSMVPGLVILIGAAALAWKYRRTKPVVTFAVLWIAVTMAIPSNLIMVTGFVLAERTLFLASGAVALLIAIGFLELWDRAPVSGRSTRNLLQVSLALVLAMAVTQSAVRNPVWKDNEALFTHTVEDVPLSSRAHWMLAEHYAMTNRAKAGADEMLLAVALGPKNSAGLVKFGAEQIARGGMCSRAMPLFKRALTLTPKDAALRHDAGQCLRLLGQLQAAQAVESGQAIR